MWWLMAFLTTLSYEIITGTIISCLSDFVRPKIASLWERFKMAEDVSCQIVTLFSMGESFLKITARTLGSLQMKAQSMLYLVFNPRDTLSVLVKMPTGEHLKPEIKALYTIRDLKAIIGSMVGFSVSDWNLIYAGKELEDWKTLACYNIGENSIVEMLPSTYQIFVKGWNGKTVILDVQRQDTVRDVKDKIFNKLLVPVKVQSLVYAGKSLEDYRNLASYNIQKQSTLHVVFWPATLVHRMKFSDIGPLSVSQGCLAPLPILPSSTTVGDLKDILEKILKKPVKEVFVNTFALQDHLCLTDYAIEKDTMLTIALEIR